MKLIYKLLLIIIFFVIISIVYRKLSKIDFLDSETNRLGKNGFLVKNKIINSSQVDYLSDLSKKKQLNEIKKYVMSQENIQKLIRERLGPKYVFQDYIFLIMKSRVHTCHRDYNGHFFNNRQRHPSYTMLLYLTEMDNNLDIIAGSHRHKFLPMINITDKTKTVHVKKGGLIIFDANLIHAGSYNKNPNNPRIQMKISHIDDLDSLRFYQNYNKYLDLDNKVSSVYQKIQKHFSCQFPFLSDLNQTKSIMTTQNNSSGEKIPWTQRLFSLLFYGRSDYYDLPNGN